MQNINELYELITKFAPDIIKYILMGLGALVVMGYSYIKVTPNQDDDAWLQKLEGKPIIGFALKLLVKFSPVVRKEIEEKKDA